MFLSAFCLFEGLPVYAGINNCHYPQGRWSSSGEKKAEEKEWTEAQMPFYSLSLGEEEEVEELALKLTPGDSESHPEPTEQVLQEVKVKVPELGEVGDGGGEGMRKVRRMVTKG